MKAVYTIKIRRKDGEQVLVYKEYLSAVAPSVYEEKGPTEIRIDIYPFRSVKEGETVIYETKVIER